MMVTVITVVRNGAATIEAALQSVAEQDYAPLEHVVVDGASTDATLDIARRFRVTIMTGSDAGIYDAMNKGIAAARGEWLLFLGADDRLAAPDVIHRLVEAARENTLLVYGDAAHFPSRFDATLLFHNTIHHQAALYRRSLFDAFRFRTDLRALSDYELNLKLYRERAPVIRVPRVVAVCGMDGASSSPAHRWANVRELHRVRARHLSAAWNAFATAVMFTRACGRSLYDRVRRR
jgi:glycosyltransferase involved in cell wall biosynthesis